MLSKAYELKVRVAVSPKRRMRQGYILLTTCKIQGRAFGIHGCVILIMYITSILLTYVDGQAIHGKYLSDGFCDRLTEFTWYRANLCHRLASSGPYVLYTGSMDVDGASTYVRKTYNSPYCSGVPSSTVTFDTSCTLKGTEKYFWKAWSEKYFWFDSTKVYNYEYRNSYNNIMIYPEGKWYLTTYHTHRDCGDSPFQVHAIHMKSGICEFSKTYWEREYVQCSGRWGVELGNCVPAYGGFYTKKSTVDQEVPLERLYFDAAFVAGYNIKLSYMSLFITMYIL